jgi:hypothetical protein
MRTRSQKIIEDLSSSSDSSYISDSDDDADIEMGGISINRCRKLDESVQLSKEYPCGISRCVSENAHNIMHPDCNIENATKNRWVNPKLDESYDVSKFVLMPSVEELNQRDESNQRDWSWDPSILIYDVKSRDPAPEFETFLGFQIPNLLTIPDITPEEKIKRLNNQKATIEKEIADLELEIRMKEAAVIAAAEAAAQAAAAQDAEYRRLEAEAAAAAKAELLRLENIARDAAEKSMCDEVKRILSLKVAKFGMAVGLLLSSGYYMDLDDIVIRNCDVLTENTDKLRDRVIVEALQIKYQQLFEDICDTLVGCKLAPLSESNYPELYDSYITDSFDIVPQ